MAIVRYQLADEGHELAIEALGRSPSSNVARASVEDQ